MSRRTQLTTKFVFSIMAQLSENFIFIYLGLSLFTEPGLEYKPLFILITVVGICCARYCAVFPLASLINWFIRYRARRRGQGEVAEEIPQNWKIMIFWAGLRGAVGVALAAGLAGPNAFALRATVLVVVVLTVIIFGGTTSRMLEILNIRTGVVEEIDSDDEFDIEPVPHTGAYARKNGSAFGHTPKSSILNGGGGVIGLDHVKNSHRDRGNSTYSTGNANGSPPLTQPDFNRRNSSRTSRRGAHLNADAAQSAAEQGLLDPEEFSNINSDDEFDYGGDDGDDEDGLDLPPSARRSPQRRGASPGNMNPEADSNNPYPVSGNRGGAPAESGGGGGGVLPLSARAALNQVWNEASTENAGSIFNRIDENFLKPHLLLDPGGGGGGSGGGSKGHGGGSA